MSFIVFDLEFNQAFNSKSTEVNEKSLKCPFEIIQIGAIKLNDKLETVATLDRLVKPYIFHELPLYKEMTGITQNNLSSAKEFKEVFRNLLN